MKISLSVSARCRVAALALLAGLAGNSASAQNFVRNPDFELPLGPDNWTVGYAAVFNGGANQPTNCGPLDFLIAGRSTLAHKDMTPGTWDGEDRTGTNYWSKFGGHFMPNHSWQMHGYFTQTITNLTPNATYVCSAWMGFYGGNYLDRCNIYLESIGGPNGRISKTTPWPSGQVQNVQNNPAGWQRYALTNTASPTGQMEIRLHFNKFGTAANWEWRNWNAFYDHVAVVPLSQPTYQPPYRIVSFTCTNQEVTLRWRTIMNNRYRLQYTTNLADPGAWTWVKWSPKLDTNLAAPGATLTFRTNLSSLVSFAPTGDSVPPIFFRIFATTFQP
jgi:hypothetical protein